MIKLYYQAEKDEIISESERKIKKLEKQLNERNQIPVVNL